MSGRVAGTISWVRNCTFWKRGTGPIIAACVEQGGQDHETLDARCIAHILEHGCARKTHPDRATHRAGGRGRHEPGFGRVYARKHGFDGGYARARIL